MLKRIFIWSSLCIVLFPASAQTGKGFILQASSFKHYIDYFNNREDENIKQAIPNDSAWGWMKNNIPLFECPQQNFWRLYK